MRKNLTGVLIVLLLCIGLAQSSNGQSKVEYLLNWGVSNPAAPDNFTNGWNTGYTVGFGIDVPLNERISWRSSFDFSSHGPDVSGLRFIKRYPDNTLASPIGPYYDIYAKNYYGSVRFYALSSSIKVKPFVQKNYLPYLLGGVGLVSIRMNAETRAMDLNYESEIPGSIKRIKNETAFVINWGAGYKFPDNGWFGGFIEATFSNAFTSGENTLFAQLKTGFSIR